MTKEAAPKGLHNPWSRPAKAEPTVADELQALARPGRSPVSFTGRVYLLMVTLPCRLPKERVQEAASHVLGECLSRLRSKAFDALLAEQKLAFVPEALLVPTVSLALGPVTLYAAASSQDETMALRLAIDRLALALTQARLTLRGTGEVLREHSTEILRAPR